jgi:hypothetical protein
MKRLSKIPAIAELQREVGPGKCPFCEEPLTEASRVKCGQLDCVVAYERLAQAHGRSFMTDQDKAERAYDTHVRYMRTTEGTRTRYPRSLGRVAPK